MTKMLADGMHCNTLPICHQHIQGERK